MLDAIRRFVTQRITPELTPVSPEDVVPEGARGDSDHRVRLAACALLLELAHADGEFSIEEREHIEGALARHFGLDDATTAELIKLADSERQKSIDHFQFTRIIAEHYDLGQRMVLAEVMWGVILADGQIAQHESYLVRKLAHLLDLQPAYLSEARRAAAKTQ
ncbi:MAG: TerB family tellurite resistance protein [Gemmatimonadales bacterium]|nr:MAG: TerB family tellurite resistance protein [Gemmatimonadales bacterium]